MYRLYSNPSLFLIIIELCITLTYKAPSVLAADNPPVEGACGGEEHIPYGPKKKKKEKQVACLKENIQEVNALILKQVNEYCARERKKQRKKNRERKKIEHQNASGWRKTFKSKPADSASSSSAESDDYFDARQQQEQFCLRSRHIQKWNDIESSSETSEKESDLEKRKQKESLTPHPPTSSTNKKKRRKKKKKDKRVERIQQCILSAYNYRAANIVSSKRHKAKQQGADLVVMQKALLESLGCKDATLSLDGYSSTEEEVMLKQIEQQTKEKMELVDRCLNSKALLGWSSTEAEEQLQIKWEQLEKKCRRKKKKRQKPRPKVDLEAKECTVETTNISSAKEALESLDFSSNSDQSRAPTSLAFFELHYSDPGEPPDNNTSPPPYLFENGRDPQLQDPLADTHNDTLSHVDHEEDNSISEETFPLEQQATEKDLLYTLQQTTTISLEDIAYSLQRIGQEMKQINNRFHVFASIDKGKKTTYASQVGLISSITDKVYLGVSYSYTHHSPYAIQTTRSDIVSTKVENHIFSGSITYNSSGSGFTSSLKGTYGIGKAKNSCIYALSNEPSSGKTSTQLKGSSISVGYTIACVPQYLVTPYIELSKLYTTMYGYTEHSMLSSKQISAIKAGLTEISFGLHNKIHLTDTIHLQGNVECIRGIQKHAKVSSKRKVIHNVLYVSTPAYKKMYTQIGLNASMYIPLNAFFGVSIHGSLYSKTKHSINKDTIGLSLWYEF